MWRQAAVAVGVVLVLSACGAGAPGTSAPTSSGGKALTADGNATVVRVVDGDTIVAEVGGRQERVRLIGIDTPESVAPNRPVGCYGKEASTFTMSLLPAGTRLRLERDTEARDTYDRLLAYTYRASDGLFVNLVLAQRGYANTLTIRPNTAHEREFTTAVAAAKAARLGLWGACPSFGAPASG